LEKKILIIDYETIPDEKLKSILPPVEASKSLKDPVKIEADIKKKTEDQINKMNMNPLTNIICCAGYADNAGNVGHIKLKDEDSEKPLIEEVWDFYAGYDHFVTFNGRPFDFRCLYLHSMKHKVKPSINISSGRYNKGNHTDLMPIFTGSSAPVKGLNLEFFCQLFLGIGKVEGICGADVYNWWLMGDVDFIAKYCEVDCIRTRDLFYMAIFSGLIDAVNS
jgi:predicted PolB exonuclease-like 3'-5' exonuclease